MAVAELVVDRRLRPLRGIHARLRPGCLALCSRPGDQETRRQGDASKPGLLVSLGLAAAAVGRPGIRAVELDAGRDDVYYSRYCRHPAALGYPPGLISSQLY